MNDFEDDEEFNPSVSSLSAPIALVPKVSSSDLALNTPTSFLVVKNGPQERKTTKLTSGTKHNSLPPSTKNTIPSKSQTYTVGKKTSTASSPTVKRTTTTPNSHVVPFSDVPSYPTSSKQTPSPPLHETKSVRSAPPVRTKRSSKMQDSDDDSLYEDEDESDNDSVDKVLDTLDEDGDDSDGEKADLFAESNYEDDELDAIINGKGYPDSPVHQYNPLSIVQYSPQPKAIKKPIKLSVLEDEVSVSVPSTPKSAKQKSTPVPAAPSVPPIAPKIISSASSKKSLLQQIKDATSSIPAVVKDTLVVSVASKASSSEEEPVKKSSSSPSSSSAPLAVAPMPPKPPVQHSALWQQNKRLYPILHAVQKEFYGYFAPYLCFMEQQRPQSIFKMNDHTLLTPDILRNLNPSWMVSADPVGDYAFLFLGRESSCLWIANQDPLIDRTAWESYESMLLPRKESKMSMLFGKVKTGMVQNASGQSSVEKDFVVLDILQCATEIAVQSNPESWNISDSQSLMTKGNLYYRMNQLLRTHIHEDVKPNLKIKSTVRSTLSSSSSADSSTDSHFLHLRFLSFQSLEQGGLKKAEIDSNNVTECKGFMLYDPNSALDVTRPKLNYSVLFSNKHIVLNMETSLSSIASVRPEQIPSSTDSLERKTTDSDSNRHGIAGPLPIYSWSVSPVRQTTSDFAHTCYMPHYAKRVVFEGYADVFHEQVHRYVLQKTKERGADGLVPVSVQLPKRTGCKMTVVGPATNHSPCLPVWMNQCSKDVMHQSLFSLLIASFCPSTVEDVMNHFELKEDHRHFASVPKDKYSTSPVVISLPVNGHSSHIHPDRVSHFREKPNHKRSSTDFPTGNGITRENGVAKKHTAAVSNSTEDDKEEYHSVMSPSYIPISPSYHPTTVE